MAGESPDRSEQGKSSGETTQGERDPRLAVFRQATPRTEPVDQPTAVFTTRPRDAEPDSSAASADPADEPAPSGNDARLRAAVAAWVATADENEETSAPAEEASAADEAAGTPEGSATDAGAPGAAPVAGERDSGTGAQTEPESASDGDAVTSGDVTAGTTADDNTADEASAETEGPAGPAPRKSASAADEDASEAATSAPDEPPADEMTSAEPEAEAPEASEAAREPLTEAEGPAEPVEPEEAPADADEAARATVPADAGADAEADAEAEAEAEPGPGSASSSDRGDASDAADDADRTGSQDAADGSDDERPRPSWAQKKASSDSGEGGEGDEESANAKPARGPVDQPTAVFKSLRRPAVDQPTTALKVPPVPKPAQSDKPARPTPEPAEGGSKARRDSTFVPLRRDDAQASAPAAPRPATAEPAAPKPAAEPAAPVSLAESERTKQQPMPPLPPLDLLAELTNTPPPPQTPVRTLVRRVKIWTPLAVLVLIIFAVVQLVRPLPEPQLGLSAQETFTFEGGQLSLPWPSEGQGAAEVVGVGSLGTYGAQKPAPIASVAKTMTAWVILRDHPITGKEVGPKITVDKQAEDESKIDDESTAAISQGQQFTEKQMLQMLMIPSGNNAARLLARWDAGSEAKFVEKMNDAAKDLGMTGSTYTDPSGLKASTVSTPQDQLKLAKKVMENDIFREIVNTTQTTVDGLAKPIRNNNDRALLLDGVGGIKTGSSTPAGGNLLWAANALVDGKPRRIVGIVMGAQNADQLWKKLELAIDYSIEVIQAAQQGVTSTTVVKKGDVVGHVDDGLGGRTPVVATKDLKAVGWAGLKVQIKISGGNAKIPHTARAGTEVGEVTVGSGPGKVSAPVELQRDLAEPGLGAKLTRVG
ncbi:serine hydrolase [Streptomyces sp. NBC_00390]|uniref:serine hydrolase n=1 Tax=Streptomyces sp. NBC_00390 TaxID=2975736 RepID=UPI0030E22B2C